MQKVDIIIVGAGHGGAQAALALRQHGFEGSIMIIGRELEPPYERPPLSKEYLAKEKPFERLYIRPPAFWGEKDIVLRLSTEITAVDPIGKTVTQSDGVIVEYGDLIWATGGDPRQLSCPGAELNGVHYVRNRHQVDTIMAELDSTENVVVIGGGYIGLEAAAVLNKLGKHVTLIETLPRVLARVAGEELSTFYEAEHRAHGVDLRTRTSAVAIAGEDGQVCGVKLDDASILPAQMVIVGIGIIPATTALTAAGASGVNGVDVDQHCRTSLPHVWAIGDCAAHQNDFAGGARIRLESVQNANDQATIVAKAICGEYLPYHATPWFWSNQYDLRLQTIGLSTGYDQTVLRGVPAARKFSVIYLKQGHIIALDCVNNVRDYSQGRKLVEMRLSVSANQLADTEIQLKDMPGEHAH